MPTNTRPARPNDQSSPGGAGTQVARLALAVLLLGAFMGVLDATIVNVAIPTIRTGPNPSDAAVAWTASGYAWPSVWLSSPPGGSVAASATAPCSSQDSPCSTDTNDETRTSPNHR